MIDRIDIRKNLPTDIAALKGLYLKAFPDEDLSPLLRELLNEKDGVLSLIAVSGSTLVGHVIFTMCSLDGRSQNIALLGPLAVSPKVQQQGIGSALVKAGFERVKSEGIEQVNVLGDPAYYSRFGFKADGDVLPPYKLPAEWETAWQLVSLNDGSPDLAGKLSVPAPWRQPHLWLP